MRPQGATFWRLGGLSGWQQRTASADLAVSDRQGLSLSAAPAGPLSLDSADGSFGGLTLPRKMAFDSALTLYLVDQTSTVRRYDPESHTFVPFASFVRVANIAIVNDWLYVATGDDVQIIDLARSIVIDVLDVKAIDLAVHKGVVYILSSEGRRVWRHSPYGRLELDPVRAGEWTRITVDKEGELYLLHGNVLERRDPKAPPIADAGAIRDRFDPPAVRMDPSGRFTLAASLALVCGRTVPVEDRQSCLSASREIPALASRRPFCTPSRTPSPSAPPPAAPKSSSNSSTPCRPMRRRS